MIRKARLFDLPLLLLVGLLVLAGCNKAKPRVDEAKGQVTHVVEKMDKQTHDHGSWWCDEHGVPEAVCGQCNSKLAAEFKKKGDWCKEHDRPDSQCFIHHPELKEKFTAQFRAKYGKEPPPTEDEEKKAQNKG
jgi:hypothetical protein